MIVKIKGYKVTKDNIYLYGINMDNEMPFGANLEYNQELVMGLPMIIEQEINIEGQFNELKEKVSNIK